MRFLVGWFRDTLPAAPIERLAVLRFDADMYQVTMDVLVNLYEKLSISEYLIIGSYGREGGCTAAVDDFRQQRGITEPMQRIGWAGVYWQRLR